MRASVDAMLPDLSEPRYGPLGWIEFRFRGRTYRAPEPMDVLPVGAGEAGLRWAMQQIIDGTAIYVAGGGS